MKIIILILLIITIGAVFSGCLETKEAEPAFVNQATINTLGWEQSGDVQKGSLTQQVGDMDLVINSAIVSYYDKALLDDINNQFGDHLGMSVSSTNPQDQNMFSSLFLTIRLALPGGISIPESVLLGTVDNLIQEMAQKNGIKNFNESGEETVIISTGSKVKARSYEGYIEGDSDQNTRLKVWGIIASWTGDGTTTIVIGVIPAQDIIYGTQTQTGSPAEFTIEIDEDKEYQEILTLIKNVE
jgi:hypothetical protein